MTRPAAWEAGGGWIYWTWKVEDADEWSYQAGLNFGWIPRDPTQRIYPGICDRKYLKGFVSIIPRPPWFAIDLPMALYIPLDAGRRAIR